METLRAAFRGHCDDEDDNNSTLTILQAKRALKAVSIGAKSDEIQEFVGEDTEEVELDAFLQFGAVELARQEKARQAFDLFDKDGKGVVVLQDLQRVSEELGEKFSDEQLEEMIELIDRSGDGLLMPQDFFKLARKVNL